MTPVVLITGASSGIGRATALAFAAQGARLVLGSRNEVAAQRVLSELQSRPDSQAVYRPTDVSREADIRALAELALERFGRLDIAINNAAMEVRGRIDAFDEEAYGRVFDVNVKGMFFAMKAEVVAMRRSSGGSIVNISSTGGGRGMAGMSIYAASKHAVEGLSKSAALELAGENIRVNVIAPGPTLTPMLERVTDGHPEAFAKRVPLGRAASPDEVAHAIVWIASAEASFVNGAVMPVNGGITAG
jgi:NAD(P)-dependent dehydrogenase (short-subunit alcohol dehydrogenase family)